MIKISSSKTLLILLILGCVINGAVFEALFLFLLVALIYQNREEIVKNHYYRWFILIMILYIAILLITMFIFKTAVGWRPVGITKTLCGLSACVLVHDKLCEDDIESVFIVYLIIFNLLFSIFGPSEECNIALIRYLDYPGQNTLGCLNMIVIPHILKTYKGWMRGLRFVFMITFTLFFFNNIGFTTVFSTLIVVVWFGFSILSKSVKVKIPKSFKRKHMLIPVVVITLIILFFYNQHIQDVYLNLLYATDRDRYAILSQAIYSISTGTRQQLMWGRGDNNYYMLTGRYVVAHNFIVEVITFDGLIGLAVLILDTFFFIRFMLYQAAGSYARKSVFLSLILAYLFFLLHPVYTTSFLVKIFLVFTNLKACKKKIETDSNAQI